MPAIEENYGMCKAWTGNNYFYGQRGQYCDDAL